MSTENIYSNVEAELKPAGAVVPLALPHWGAGFFQDGKKLSSTDLTL